MDKSTKHYWAVFQGREVKFEGSFSECWQHFVGSYGNETVKTLVKRGIHVGRKG